MMLKRPLRAETGLSPEVDMGTANPPLSKFVSSWLSVVLLIGLISALAPSQAGYAGASVDGSAAQPIRYMIVVTGGELLSGVYADGHTYFLTRTLSGRGGLGLRCVGSMCVDDKRPDLKEALRFAKGKAALVIVTGGLGPTNNDITREALAEFTGIPLKEHPDVLQEMALRFRVPAAQLRPNLRRQAQVPTSGTYFKNPNGTAVGLVFEMADAVVVALPGPPRELQAMVRDELVPYLSRRFGTRLPGCSLTLRFVGLGQSQIDQTLGDHVQIAPDVTVSSQFEGSRVDFTFSLPNDTPRDRTRLGELKQEVMKHLGEYVYADDDTSLEQHVVELLEARGETLALAEAGSGGSLTATLSVADGAERVLAGAYVAPTAERLRRLLRMRDEQQTGSPPMAPAQQESSTSANRRIEQLAVAVADVTASQWAVAVGEARLDKSGVSYVEVAFKLPSGCSESQQVRLRGSGELARSRLSTQLLDQLRRRLK
jgi:nicotinamide-nucleotide amidase